MKRNSAARSAFFNPRILMAFALCAVGIAIAMLAFGLSSGASAQAQNQGTNGMQVAASYHNDVSRPLRSMAPWNPADAKSQHEHEANENPKVPYRHHNTTDPVVQNRHVSTFNLVAPSIPSTLLNFNGIPFPGVGCNCAPPDTNGAVGTTQYVQIVNEGYQVFD